MVYENAEPLFFEGMKIKIENLNLGSFIAILQKRWIFSCKRMFVSETTKTWIR